MWTAWEEKPAKALGFTKKLILIPRTSPKEFITAQLTCGVCSCPTGLELGNPYCYTSQLKTNNIGNTKPHFQNQAQSDQLKCTLLLKTAQHTQTPAKHQHLSREIPSLLFLAGAPQASLFLATFSSPVLIHISLQRSSDQVKVTLKQNWELDENQVIFSSSHPCHMIISTHWGRKMDAVFPKL